MSSCLSPTPHITPPFPPLHGILCETQDHAIDQRNQIILSLHPKESSHSSLPPRSLLSIQEVELFFSPSNRRLFFPILSSCSMHPRGQHHHHLFTPTREPCPMQEPISKVIVPRFFWSFQHPTHSNYLEILHNPLLFLHFTAENIQGVQPNCSPKTLSQTPWFNLFRTPPRTNIKQEGVQASFSSFTSSSKQQETIVFLFFSLSFSAENVTMET